jgi:hypothetical protein
VDELHNGQEVYEEAADERVGRLHASKLSLVPLSLHTLSVQFSSNIVFNNSIHMAFAQSGMLNKPDSSWFISTSLSALLFSSTARSEKSTASLSPASTTGTTSTTGISTKFFLRFPVRKSERKFQAFFCQLDRKESPEVYVIP